MMLGSCCGHFEAFLTIIYFICRVNVGGDQVMKKSLLNIYHIRFSLLWLFIFSEVIVTGTNIILKRKAIIHNFSKNHYQAANQNWAISQNPDGELFFGNTFGLLRYDGYTWTTHKLKDNITIRSVYADSDGKIYVGGHEEFGYWAYTQEGELTYHSVSQQLPASHHFKNEDIWQITKMNGKIFFRSFARIYLLENGKITVIDPNNAVFSLHSIHEQPYAFLLTKGFYKITDQLLLEKDNSFNALNAYNVIDAIQLNNETIIVTEKNGFFRIDGRSLEKWNSEVNFILANKHINKALVNTNRLVIGTISDGVYIFNSNGKLLEHFDKRNGLQNNTVLDIFFDHNNKLWIALDKGIDYVDLDQPIELFEDATGALGSVYAAQMHNNRLYLGTNHGIFSTPWPPVNSKEVSIQLHPHTQGQCWSIIKAGNQLLFGHNDGTYVTRGPNLLKISSISGGSNMVLHPQNGMLYQGTYIGVAIYKKNKEGWWKFNGMLQNTSIPIRHLEFDYEGNLWVSHIYKHLYRYKLNPAANAIISTTEFGEAQGFLSDYDINTFKVDNRIVFTNNDRIFTYNDINQSIIPYTQLENQLKNFSDARLITQPETNEYWFAKNTGIKGYKLVDDSLQFIQRINYKTFNHSPVDLFENVSKLTSDTYLFGLEDGFSTYQLTQGETSFKNKFQLKIRSVQAINREGEERLISNLITTKTALPYQKNRLTFTLSAPGIINQSVKYYYRLSSQDEWIPLVENKLNINNLKWGDYSISFMALNQLSQQTDQQNYNFTITPPRTLHPIAIILYALTLVTLILSIRKIMSLRLKQQKLVYLKKLKRLNEKQIIEMKNKLLQTKVADKSKELANYTMLLKRKNEVLTELRNEINQLELSKTKNNVLTKAKALKIISNNLSDKNDLEVFNLHFNEGHDNFIQKLRQKHPDLTPNDLRLCAFLRMNLMSKEIALLLNLTPRSVEVKRYRLRKKLDLNTEDNLTNYLLEL